MRVPRPPAPHLIPAALRAAAGGVLGPSPLQLRHPLGPMAGAGAGAAAAGVEAAPGGEAVRGGQLYVSYGDGEDDGEEGMGGVGDGFGGLRVGRGSALDASLGLEDGSYREREWWRRERAEGGGTAGQDESTAEEDAEEYDNDDGELDNEVAPEEAEATAAAFYTWHGQPDNGSGSSNNGEAGGLQQKEEPVLTVPLPSELTDPRNHPGLAAAAAAGRVWWAHDLVDELRWLWGFPGVMRRLPPWVRRPLGGLRRMLRG